MIAYSKLKLKINKEVNTITFNEQNIDVLKYLPQEDKFTLVMCALRDSFVEGIYNEIRLDMYFHLYLVYMYTNISFTDKQKEDESKLYDQIKSSGLLDAILEAIEDDEYAELQTYTEAVLTDKINQMNSLAAVVDTFVNKLPQNANMVTEIMEKWNPEQFKEVIAFAKAANNGKPVQ